MQENIIALTSVKEGKSAELVGVEGGSQLNRRLADMGLIKGVRVKVLNCHGRGPCVVRLGDSRLILGYGMAHRVMVKEI